MRPKALAALALAALALAGCGGDEEDAATTITGSGGGTATARADDLSPRQQRKLERLRQRAEQRPQKQQGGPGGNPAAPVPFEEPSGPAPTSAASLPNEGSRAVAPGVPLARGGDNSIQTYGVEGPAAERVGAARVAKAYFDARAARRWAQACSYMSEQIKAQMAQLGGEGQSPDCASGMGALTAGVSKAALRNAAEIRVLSMRVEDERALLLYRDGEGTPSALPMRSEGGAWKVDALAGSALFLGV